MHLPCQLPRRRLSLCRNAAFAARPPYAGFFGMKGNAHQIGFDAQKQDWIVYDIAGG